METRETHTSSDVLGRPSTSRGSGFAEEIQTSSQLENCQLVLSAIQEFEFPQHFEEESFKAMGISIQMDFSEALTEISISQEILESLTEFFTSENCLSLEVIFSGISKLTKNITLISNQFINYFILPLVPLMDLTMAKFLNRLPIWKTLNHDDQVTLNRENYYMVFHYSISMFLNALTAEDQFTWLLFKNIPEKGKPLPDLLI